MLTVVGPPGSGKSALLARAVIAVPPSTVIARYIGVTPQSAHLVSLLRDLVRLIRTRHPAQPGSADAEPAASGHQAEDVPWEFGPLVNAFHEALSMPTADHPLRLVIDALDQFDAMFQARDLHWLPLRLSDHVSLVVSAASAPMNAATDDPRVEVASAFRRRIDSDECIELAPLEAEHGTHLLTRWLAQSGRTLQPAQQNRILSAFTIHRNPLWLRIAACEAGRLASWMSPPDYEAELDALLRQVIQRLQREREHGTALISRVLGYLACSRGGLTEDEMIELLSTDKVVMRAFHRRFPRSSDINVLPAAVWVSLREDITAYVVEHSVAGASVLRFYHLSFADAARSECVSNPRTKKMRHAHLSRYFLHQADPDDTLSWRGRNSRAFSELPSQLAASWPGRLATILLEFDWIQAKADQGMVVDLVQDFHLAEHAIECDDRRRRALELMRKALELSMHVIAADSRQAASQIVGRLGRFADRRLARVVAGARRWRGAGWLRPIISSLTAPDGAIVRSLLPGGPRGPVQVIIGSLANTVLSGAADGKLRVWDIQRGYEIVTLGAHSGPIVDLAGAADGGTAASISANGDVKIWDTHSTSTLPIYSGNHRPQAHCISASGDIVAYWLPDETVIIWQRGRDLRSLRCKGHFLGVNALAVNENAGLLYSASSDKTIIAWDMNSGRLLRRLAVDREVVESLALSPNSELLATVASGCVRIWSTQSWKQVAFLEEPETRLSIPTWLPSGVEVLTFDGTVLRMWNIVSGDNKVAIPWRGSAISSLMILPGGREVAVGTQTGELKLLQFTNRSLRQYTVGSAPTHITMSDDGTRAMLASATSCHILALPIARLLPHDVPWNFKLNAIGLSGRADSLWVLGGEGVRVYDRRSGSQVCHHKIAEGAHVAVGTASSNGRWMLGFLAAPAGFATLTSDTALNHEDAGKLLLWDCQNPDKSAEIPDVYIFGGVTVALSDDGRRVFAAHSARELPEFAEWLNGVVDSTVNPASLRRRLEIDDDPHYNLRRAVNNLPTRSKMARRLFEKVYYTPRSLFTFWSRPEGSRESIVPPAWSRRSFALGDDDISHIACSAGTTKVVVASSTGTLRVVDIETGLYHTIGRHAAPITSLLMSQDGRFAVTSARDQSVRVWQIENPEQFACFTGDSSIGGIAMDAVGSTLLAFEHDGSLHHLQLVTPATPMEGDQIPHADAHFEAARKSSPLRSSKRGVLNPRNSTRDLIERAVDLECRGHLRSAAKAALKGLEAASLMFGLIHPWTRCAAKNLDLLRTEPFEPHFPSEVSPHISDIIIQESKSLRKKHEKVASRLRLLSPRSATLAYECLVRNVEDNKKLSASKLEANADWLLHFTGVLIGGGCLALHELIGGEADLETITGEVLALDLARDATLPFGERPKSTLFALSSIGRTFKPELVMAKVGPAHDVLNIDAPFIAHCHEESFILVTKYTDRTVSYQNSSVEYEEDDLEFVSRINGFVLVPSVEALARCDWQKVPDELAGYCWG